MIVNGNTVIINGERMRVALVDAALIAQPRCMDEMGKGQIAAGRLRLLLKGPIEVERALMTTRRKESVVYLSSAVGEETRDEIDNTLAKMRARLLAEHDLTVGIGTL